MANRYAVIASGQVINVGIWDGSDDWEPPDGSTTIRLPDNSPVGPGYAYDGSNFSAPPAQPQPSLP